MRYEMRLSGEGGQGLITGGIIIAEAAILDGLNAVQTQSYGPESRGGASKAEVIISDGDIDYPKVTNPDLFLAMTQEAFDRYVADLKAEGLLLVDSTFVTRLPAGESRLHALPITELARERLGREIVANIIAVGTIVALSQVVSRSAIETAVLRRVPKGTEDLNRRALALGFAVAEEVLAKA